MSDFFPMVSLELRPHRHTIPAGTELWRVHQSRYAPDQFNPTLADIHFQGGRFDGTLLDRYHSLYLAHSPVTALAESVLRSQPFETPISTREIPYATVFRRSLSVLRTTAELTLASLIEEEDLAAVCQNSVLLEDERNYARSRRWSSEIRAQATDAQGLIWQSRRNRPQHALVLFHDRFGPGDGRPLEVLRERAILDLGSQEGRKQANQLLEPLRARISEPLGH